jgi:hypothetical protein
MPDFSATVVSFQHGSYTPIAIISRKELEFLPSFMLHVVEGSLSVSLSPIQIHIDDKDLQSLFHYTLRICRLINGAVCCCPSVDLMDEFYAPLTATENNHSLPSGIDWNEVRTAVGTWAINLNLETPGALSADIDDALIIDRWDENHARRYPALCVREDLTPYSKIEDNYVTFVSHFPLIRLTYYV